MTLRALLVINFAVGLAFGGPGAPVKPTQIVCIDYGIIQEKSSAMVKLRETVEELRKKYHGEFSKIEDELRSVDNELRNNQQQYTASQFTEIRKQLDHKTSTARRMAYIRHKQLNLAYKNAVDKVNDNINQITLKILQEPFIILDKRQIMHLAGSGIDITQEVLNQLDKQLPKVEFILPKEEEIEYDY